jgi:D-alanyl-lipoteichoic acid acyltransferase DltB (MBOAT superfamily)
VLFNSLEFCLVFLPAALAGYWLLRHDENVRLWYLIAISIAFYSYWDWRVTPLLIVSVLLNWWASERHWVAGRRAILIGAIVANLTCLAAFKYMSFFAASISQATGVPISVPQLVLPLGISFFTFHHIIYLVDLLKGRAPRYSLRDYALYIVLFPQILAGPLVRHSEIVHQFRTAPWADGWERRWVQGLALFAIGLAKKLFLADPLSVTSDEVFQSAQKGPLTFLDAWSGVLSFTFQIYFDFSGYSDMAIGLALLLGFKLPVNFDAPYRAVDISDFWRRWHMTLSRFLRDYLYIPFGGNRHGVSVQIWALLATMVLGGLWHGAGWTFIVWGALHGVALVMRVLWQNAGMPSVPVFVSWGITMLFVCVTWVFFRAGDLASAILIVESMAGWGSGLGKGSGWVLIAVCAFVTLALPTSQALVEKAHASWWIGLAIGVALAAAILKINNGNNHEFIYFQF